MASATHGDRGSSAPRPARDTSDLLVTAIVGPELASRAMSETMLCSQDRSDAVSSNGSAFWSYSFVGEEPAVLH
jgi:hypothetical protein